LRSLNRDIGHTIYYSKAKFDSFVKTLTITYIGLVSLLIVISYMFFLEGELPLIGFEILLTISIILLILPYMFSPKAYVLTHKGLVIERILNSIFIPYSEIEDASIMDFNDLSSAADIELWGSNGYCGIFGQFKMLKLGYTNLYVTKISKCILVEKLNGEKYVISPEKPEVFIRIFKKLH